MTTVNAETTATQWIEEEIHHVKITKERKAVCRLEIEQGFNRIELEFKSIYLATEVIDLMKSNVTKGTKFIITDKVEEGEQNEHSGKINENTDGD